MPTAGHGRSGAWLLTSFLCFEWIYEIYILDNRRSSCKALILGSTSSDVVVAGIGVVTTTPSVVVGGSELNDNVIQNQKQVGEKKVLNRSLTCRRR